MKKKWMLAALVCLLLTLLCACGDGSAAAVPSPEATPEPTIEARPEPTPEPTPAPILLPDGREAPADAEELDLSTMKVWQLKKTIPLLSDFSELRRVELGEESETHHLRVQILRALIDARPDVDFDYRFPLYGKKISTLDEKLDLNHIPIDDEGEAVRELLPCMKHCRYVDMDFCGVSNEAMARIRDENPQMEVVWRIWFGYSMTARTDAERIMASTEWFGLDNNNTKDLKYCTKVRLLDLGHARALSDHSFLAYMPDLEVAILGVSSFCDLTPLKDCTKLEYLEFNECRVRDLSPLAGLVNLKHLNCCLLGRVTGWEALLELKNLERLWIGNGTAIPPEGREQLIEALPNTDINFTEPTGSLGTWRFTSDGYTERYALLREQFGYDDYDNMVSLPKNDPLYEPHPDPEA